MRVASATSTTAVVELTERDVVTLLNGLQALPRSGISEASVLADAVLLGQQLEVALRALLDPRGAADGT